MIKRVRMVADKLLYILACTLEGLRESPVVPAVVRLQRQPVLTVAILTSTRGIKKLVRGWKHDRIWI